MTEVSIGMAWQTITADHHNNSMYVPEQEATLPPSF